MTTACLTEPAANTTSDGTERSEDAASRTPSLAAVLDVQVVEVPGTANAIQHFFGDV
ncbi:hypothetical protein [Actinacidiphila yeochonensis]|uniref:hypothetical protein n=1 Tax=Actinacidiphila yeochonensis TaxID=89050 RepID=UPI000AC6EBCE|nr:hypothetical protein [Actinacidiphila yeochonensis]